MSRRKRLKFGFAIRFVEVPRILYFFRLARELSNRGHEVTIITDRKHKAEKYFGGIDGQLLKWPSKGTPSVMCDGRFLSAHFLGNGLDCFIAGHFYTYCFLPLAALNRIPVRILWYRSISAQVQFDSGYSPLKMLLRDWRLRFLANNSATHLVINAEVGLEDLQKYRVAKNKVYLHVPPVPDADSRQIPNSETPSYIMLNVGRLTKSKGQATVLHAIARVRALLPSLKVRFVGGGSLEAELKLLAKQLGVMDRCEFLGHLPHKQTIDLMKEADATIVASLEDMFAMVCAESLSVGTPVIGSRTGGIPEAVRDGIEGSLFEPGNVEDLANAIINFYSKGEMAQLRKNARARYEEKYSDANLTQQADWYCEAVERSALNLDRFQV